MSAVPKKVADAVDARDEYSCTRCGVSLASVSGSRHHRQSRAVGWQHVVQNLILLCGSGTTGCHGEVHSRPGESRAAGFIISRHAVTDPAEIPIHTWRHGWALLNDDGTMSPIDKKVARELMDELFGEVI